MNSKKTAFITFILVALLQVYVPARIILDQEKVIATGQEFKFKTAPIDPSDPFRGKYITLSYDDDTIIVPKNEDWASGELAYVLITRDQAGFAKINSVAKKKPNSGQDYFKAKVNYFVSSDTNQVVLDFPFDRLYMEESKAYPAEQAYQKALIDTTKITYAVVKVHDGHAVLTDVRIGNTSIRDIVKPNQ